MEMICTVCPKGCRLQVELGEEIRVSGQGCARGVDYAVAEVTNPTRVLTSTVRIAGAIHRLCPVRTAAPIPKRLLFDAVRQLRDISLEAPVALGDVVVPDICGTGVDIITTRDMERVGL